MPKPRPAQPPMIRDASISDCQQYRWRLSRCWDPLLPVAGWLLLNPSTANASVDDPTVRRMVGFSASWGYGAIWVRNLFAVRTAYPRELPAKPDPVGAQADAVIRELAACKLVVVGWGSNSWPGVARRAAQVTQLLAAAGIRPMCLGVNGDGAPKHPLYLAATTPLVAYAGGTGHGVSP